MQVDITRREWIIALLIALAIVALLSIPYILGYSLTRPGTIYSGLVMNPEDSQSYFAKMLQGFEGRWLYTIPFTPEHHEPAFLGGFYLALGHIARVIEQPLAFVWHAARFVTGLILFLVTFGFVATFLHNGKARWTAYFLAVLGSGLGWLLFVLGQTEWLGAFPVDFKMPEAHLFFTALTFPHVALGTTLLMASFWLILKAIHDVQRAWLFALLAGLVNLAIGIVYPFLIYLVVLAVGMYWVYLCLQANKVRWREAGLITLAFLLPAPLYLYYAYTYQVNDIFRAWSDQAGTPSPPVPHYLVAYGILLLLALLPLRKRQDWPGSSGPTAFLWIWLIAAAILLYAPLNPQRRFVQGLQVPLSILATIGLFQVVLPWMERSRPFQALIARPRYSTQGLVRFILFSFLLIMSLSNLYLLADVSVTAGLRQPYPFFRTENEMIAMKWLRDAGERSAVVLAAPETGNVVASHAGNPVVSGHWAETVNWSERLVETNHFYDANSSDSWRRDLLEKHNVSYVWFGPQEKTLGQFSPDDTDYLTRIYAAGETEIYAVSE